MARHEDKRTFRKKREDNKVPKVDRTPKVRRTLSIDQMHTSNKNLWNRSAKLWGKRADDRGLWRTCHEEPRLVLCDKVMEVLKGVSGKRVCVLGSGDNEVVFAMAGLGARVTSVDISQAQLDIASGRTKKLGLDITFKQADVIDLRIFKDEEFNVVYTGGHVAVWVADLQKYYAEAVRILRPGGLFIVEEYHPFRRVWKESRDELVVASSYFERGPFEHELSNDILYKTPGDQKSYEFHWTVSDYINAILRTKCRILGVHEYGEGYEEWEDAPVRGLPEFLLIVAEKPR